MHASQNQLQENLSHGTRRMYRLLDMLGNPHKSFAAIHVAGTNGKGSICAYIASVLHASGIRVGRFNSPHLLEVRDSIWIDGQPVEKAVFEKARDKVDQYANRLTDQATPSSFERLVCTAYYLFQQAGVKMGVVEVGLGGRDDATNVFDKPCVTVISAIGLDHTAILGNTLEEIASVKAGIIRRGRPVVVAPQESTSVSAVIREAAKALDAPTVLVAQGEVMTDGKHRLVLPLENMGRERMICEYPVVLHGEYQRANAATAIATLCTMQAMGDLPQLTQRVIEQGMNATRWPGRLDIVTRPILQQQWNIPSILVDGAHNPPAARALRDYCDSLPGHDRIVWIIGVTLGKDVDEMCRLLVKPTDIVIGVPFSQPAEMSWVQCTPPNNVAQHAQAFSAEALACVTLEEGLTEASRRFHPKQDMIVLCGSLYLVADFYRLVSLANDNVV